MQYDLYNVRGATFRNWIGASGWRRVLRLSLFLCVLPAGCVGAKFHGDFSSMEVQPPQSSHPFVGAWEGSWQSASQPGSHVARAVVSLNARGNYDVQVEMSAFEPEPNVSNFPFDKYWLDLREITVATTSAAAEHFQTKIQLKKANRSNLIAEAMTVQGNIQGNTLQIRFSTNDALKELDHGRIELDRHVVQGNSTALSSAFPTYENETREAVATHAQ